MRAYEADKHAHIYLPKTIELRVRGLPYGLKPMLLVQIMHEHMMQIDMLIGYILEPVL